ncbi:hypothetical protein KIH23_01460 [Flavobacterium sp. CYK-55]|uniref:hypothetical protein n=1 Tax=Flavobacterium sp. CYK-55 TaxID=2835529 RepID=UPI001BD0EBAE|nr:hypothetical protein [Flavobacterium sp. CYK-55]MBS7785950.1 hypothetical protein [Flavobacterium sp. CYK-55]
MKKILLLLILVPFSVFANFYDGTVNFNDGTSKTGLIELPENPGVQSLKFKTDIKAKPESFSINDVKGFEITEKDAEPIKYVAMHIAKGAFFGPGEPKVDKKKSWLSIVKQGKITLYAAYVSSKPGMTMGSARASGWAAETFFYLGRPDKEYATLFWLYMEGSGGVFAINNYKVIKRLTKTHFENNCPALESFIDIDDFRKNGISRIVDLYDEHCGKN